MCADKPGWLRREPDWPRAVILADNALDVLSILSLHLVPAIRRGCAVVSTVTVTSNISEWIQAWNPERIFCAYSDARNGDHAVQRLKDKDIKIVRLRPALDGQDWNDMLRRERAGEPLETDDHTIS